LDLTQKISILRWVKRKYKVNVAFVKSNLEEEDFERLLQSFAYLREIGGVYDANKLVDEFLKERGRDRKPRAGSGERVAVQTYFNTHQPQDGGVRVYLKHLLLGEGRSASRENLRFATRSLKSQGYDLKYDIPIDTKNSRKEAVLILKEDSEVVLPQGLKYYSGKEEIVDVASWIEGSLPRFYHEGVALDLDLSERWLCHYRKRFIDLFEMSEFSYLYKGDRRGFYVKSAPVEMLCHLSFRDLFASHTLDEWIRFGISHETTSYTREQEECFFSILKEYVLYNTHKVNLNSKPININAEKVYGWVAVLVLHYVREAILKGKE